MNDRLVRVLLVDDDGFAFEVIREYLAELQTAQYEVQWASSFESGVQALRTGRFEVCLLDFQLGTESGLDFLRRAMVEGFRVPFIMLTAQGDHQLDMDAMRAGAADYLVKGEFGPPLLERCIRYAVERQRTLDQLRESEERYALAVAGANDGLWDWKLDTNEIYFSPRWKGILGFTEAELLNHVDEWYLRVHPEDLTKLKSDIAAHLAGAQAHFENEHRVLHKDGTYRWVLTRGLAVRGRDGKATRLAGSQSDVTMSRGHDPLTGLPNRILYMDRLARAIERSRRRIDASFAVLYLDLDRFKIVNDSLGHVVGDELLVAIARRLETCVRSMDTVARLGGDEFTILLDHIADPADATRVAHRIHDELALPFKLGGRDVFTSASVGIALGTTGYERPEEVLRDADTAMYRAKASGKARHEVFDKAMHQRAVSLLQLETELRRAIEAGNFRIRYQPILSLSTGTMVGLEALVRWSHPTRGLVPPDEFIPLAEETGLIVQIDRWVLQQACFQLKAWQDRFPDHPPLSVSVNFSKKQFGQNDLIDEVDRILALTQVNPECVKLEITESVILENAELAAAILTRLRSRNLHIVMDDFGTGYSSLSYLHQLPFTALKIDRSFVQRLGGQGDTTEIVRAIVSLANSLGVTVTAEGVEEVSQLRILQKLNCHFGQGYLFARPVESLEAEQFLAAPPHWERFWREANGETIAQQ